MEGDNYDGAGGGNLTLIDGTARSVNAVFAHLEIDGVGDGDAFEGSRASRARAPAGDRLPDAGRARGAVRRELPQGRRVHPRRQRAGDRARREGGLDHSTWRRRTPRSRTTASRVEPTAIVRIEDADGRVLYHADPIRVEPSPPASRAALRTRCSRCSMRGTGTAAALDRPRPARRGRHRASVMRGSPDTPRSSRRRLGRQPARPPVAGSSR